VASGQALERLCERHFPGESLAGVFLEHRDHPAVTEFVRVLGLVVASEVNLIDPVTVILGGGVLGMPGFPKEFLEAEVLRATRQPMPRDDLHFRYSSDSQFNGLLGGTLSSPLFSSLGPNGRVLSREGAVA